jgi:uncharacterized membrane protein YhaH (DUF805 family)
VVPSGLGSVAIDRLTDDDLSTIALVVALIAQLLLVWISIVGGAKRCHDRDRSGWFQLIILIPVLGALWLLVELGFLRGTIGANRFGPDPWDLSTAAISPEP